jgi:hypothetical protein
MKNVLTCAALAAALAAPAAAHDYSKDLICGITDVGGNALVYSFANNTTNADGSFGGTMVETGFQKNGQNATSPAGSRPIWFWNGDVNATSGVSDVITSRDAPGWRFVLGPFVPKQGFVAAPASLIYQGREMGQGYCGRGGFKGGNSSTDGSIPPGAVGDVVGE